MRALVTGGRGFVGHWLAEHLRSCGDEVVAIDQEVDVTDADAVRRAVDDAAPEAVYHLAALAHVGQSWTDPDTVFKVNALGTMHILDAARTCTPAPRVLLVSSAEVYGVVREDALPVTEEVELAPVTPYAASKVAAEYMGVQAFLAHGLPVVRVRPFNHVGPGQRADFVVPALAERIVEARRAGRPTLAVGNLSARRDLTDVRDVVRAYRLLVERGTPGEVYNVCAGEARSIRQLAERMLELSGVDLRLEVDPALVRPVDVPVVLGDPAKLHGATGWHPEIDIDRTLADVLEQWERSAA
ncbi:MAG TPA: GDP-mannose 4,6-dehydratase [Acidimicrobiales bacterium]|nr:GDP-mannose 4,6-dehydratase [Acidimicrobiales bacterium]